MKASALYQARMYHSITESTGLLYVNERDRERRDGYITLVTFIFHKAVEPPHDAHSGREFLISEAAEQSMPLPPSKADSQA